MSEYFDKSPKHCYDCQCMSHLFTLLNKDELQQVDANKIHVRFKAGETIKKQGTFMSHVLSINSGLAKLYLEGIEGRSAILRISSEVRAFTMISVIIFPLRRCSILLFVS